MAEMKELPRRNLVVGAVGMACALTVIAFLSAATFAAPHAQAEAWKKTAGLTHALVKMDESKVKVGKKKLYIRGACYTSSLAGRNSGKFAIKMAPKVTYYDNRWKRISKKRFVKGLKKATWMSFETKSMTTVVWQMKLW